ncbi:MAG: polyprenyl synthetase family protein [Thermomicrobiales bacterium]
MPGATRFQYVRVTLEEAVASSAFPVSFRDLLALALSQEGKVLAGAARPQWPALVLASCDAADGDSAVAIQIAAAVELFMAGLDIFDEIEDGDLSPVATASSPAQALNVAQALLLLAQRQLCRLGIVDVPSDQITAYIATLTAAGLAATAGQHQDLRAESRPDVTLDDALAVARGKAGALVAGACRLGAMIGTTRPDLLALYEAWGQHYGTAAQLANDLHDAADVERKSDLARQKGTLPLIYSRSAGGAPATLAPGALHFTWVALEIERQRCGTLLEQLAAQGQAVAGLRDLLTQAN